MLSPHDKIKDYEVIAPLGSGGMAMLYLARRRGVGGFSRLVTLKLVHKHLIEDENVVKLFLDEARISAHVAHPNVVHVEEVGQCGDSYFIAMEYVHGVSLAELLACMSQRSLGLLPGLCVWLTAQIAEALHAAHEAKNEHGMPLDIVHRDVSPQNVLLAHTGHVKLIDFGIAKSQAENDQRAGRRSVLGKLGYMAPEQLRLEPADRRADVYALGVMLWEMLTGRAFLRCLRVDDERDWATRERPPPPSRFSVHSAPPLDAVVLKALAFDPSQRFATALEFRAALLRADPAAVQLDAPMVASLIRSVLGDELEKRSRSLPSEVAGELEGPVAALGSKDYLLEELTVNQVDMRVLGRAQRENELGGHAHDHEHDDDEPTQASARPSYGTAHGHSQAGDVRTDTSGDGPASLTSIFADARAPLPLTAAEEYSVTAGPYPDLTALAADEPRGAPLPADLDTLKLPPSSVNLTEWLLGFRLPHAAAVLGLSLLLGGMLGAFVPPSSAAPEATSKQLALASARPERERSSALAVPANMRLLDGPARWSPSAVRLTSGTRRTRSADSELRVHASTPRHVTKDIRRSGHRRGAARKKPPSKSAASASKPVQPPAQDLDLQNGFIRAYR